MLFLAACSLRAQSTCGNVGLSLTSDYQFAIGASDAGGAYTWTLNGAAIAQGPTTQLALFHYDNSLQSASGLKPANAVGTSFVPGKFGTALAIAKGGNLSYPVAGNLSFQDGTFEMWIAPTSDLTVPISTPLNQFLLHYEAPNGDQFQFALSTSGTLYGGTVVGGKYAGGTGAAISSWKAGEWHHIAYTYSTSNGRQRLYLDGSLLSESDAAMPMPATNGSTFAIDSDSYGDASAFVMDELRISNNEETAAQVQYDATRATAFSNNEVFLALSGVSAGQLTYQVTGTGATTPCASPAYTYTGIPITNLSPSSNLLATGSTGVSLSFNTLQATTCRYSAGSLQTYASMTPLDAGAAPTAAHQGTIAGLSPSPQVLNDVFIRCASNTDFVQMLQYRAVANPTGTFPRIGSIWVGEDLYNTKPNKAAKVQLYLGPDGLTPVQAQTLRAANPNVLILPDVSAQETNATSLPERYYLHDVHGNRIQHWPRSFILNLTEPEVGGYLANYAFQILAQSNFAYDGIFWDNVFTTVSQVNTDYLGNPVQISSNNNGMADNPATLDAAWSSGVHLLLSTFRKLAPYAFVSGHAAVAGPPFSNVFNGDCLTFDVVNVREGTTAFGVMWSEYQTWNLQAETPAITLIQSSPPNQIAYGYGYYPTPALLPSTLAFAQSFYPNMRFGLALSLMNDGFSTYDFGDTGTGSPVNWWYDEYDFNLGYAVGPAAQINLGPTPNSANILTNGGFESGLSNWTFIGQPQASVALDTAIAAEGNTSARMTVSSTGTPGSVDIEQDNVSLANGTNYQLQFWARSDAPRAITVFSQGVAPNFPGYGLFTSIPIGTSWQLYSTTFVANATTTVARIKFEVGDVAGQVWVDGVQMFLAPPSVYRRDYTNGVALLNGMPNQQTIPLEPGLQRFSGTQAPLYQYIVDDSDPTSFSSSGAWTSVAYNTGAYGGGGTSAILPAEPQNSNGPYYHCWEGTCHQLDAAASGSSAQWSLNIPADGQYTLQVWLPAAPGAASWTTSAIYEVVSAGSVVGSATVDQTIATAGDAWHMIGTFSLTAAGAPFLRVHNGGSGSVIADAVYVTSAALYNDGSPAPQVTLGPFDGILLQRQNPVTAPASRVNSVVNAADFQAAIASAGFVSIIGTGFGTSTRSWTSPDFSGTNLPTSLSGVSVTINGNPAYVEYISPTQVNVIAPDDDTIGLVQVQVQVQVVTPPGTSYTGTVLKQKLSPAFFTYPSGTTTYVVAVHLDGSLVGPAGPSSRPVVPGETIEIYGTGFGATNPAMPTSQLISQPAPLSSPATVSIGGVNAAVQWAGLVSPGLYQLNVIVPVVATGDQMVQATVSGFQSPSSVFLPVSSN